MKIQLERNLRSNADHSRCTVCGRSCYHDQLRTRLCRDDGSIVGDICTDCLSQKTGYIQKQLHCRATQLIIQPPTNDPQTPSPQKQALVLSELAHQPVAIPPFYSWWWKRLQISIAEIREFKLSRTSPATSRSRDANHLNISFLTEEPSIGKDD